MISSKFFQLDTALANKKNALELEMNFKQSKQTEISNLGKLENLELLVLSDYPPSFLFPKQIYDLRNLKSLVFKRCCFNKIPNGIGRLENLGKISLIQSSFQDFSEELLKMPSLKEMHIDNTDLANLIEADFSASQIEELTFCGILTQKFYTVFKKLKKLQSLILYSNELDHIPEQILKQNKLQSLSIIENKLDHIPPDMSKMKNLKKIDFSFNRIDKINFGFETLKKLNSVNLSNNLLRAFPSQILEINGLESLKIDNNLFDDLPEGLFKLKKFKNLDIGTEKKLQLPIVILDWLVSGKNKIVCHSALLKLLDSELYKSSYRELKRELAILHIDDFRKQHKKKLEKLKELILIKDFSTNELAYTKLVDNPYIVYKEGDLIFFWGKLKPDKEIKLAANEKGIKFTKELSEKVTKIVVNPGILDSEDLPMLLEGDRELITESGLWGFLSKDNPPYLLTEAEEAVQKLRDLLRTGNKDNMVLVFEILKNGGIPQSLYTDILKVYLFSKDSMLGNTALKLLRRNAEPGWDIALEKIIHYLEKYDNYSKRYIYISENINPEFVKVNINELLNVMSYYNN